MATNGTGPITSVVITGASTGIGEACALRLDRMGMRVFAGIRREADGEALRTKASARLTPLRIDVTDAASVAAAAETVSATVGEQGIAGLVNNAGIGVGGPLEFVAVDELRRQFEVNVFGHVTVTQAFLPLLRKARGRIVNMGSIGGRFASPFLAPYCASKFAMEAITDALRIELRPWGIGVAIVEPGSIATPIWDKANASIAQLDRDLPPRGRELYQTALDAVRSFVEDAAKRAIPPEQVAKAVSHALTSRRPKTRYLVGLDARMQAAASVVLPDRLLDRFVLQQLHLSSKADAAAPTREKAATPRR